MNIYEIDAAILSLVDEETGEIKDFEEFANLQMERETKIENIALWHKNLVAESKAIREEEKTLAERRKACENKAERLKNYLSEILQGNKFKTAKVAVSYRKSTAVEIEPDFIEWAEINADDLLTYKAPEPNKTAIKDALKAGTEIPFASMVEHQNISIK